MHRTEDLAQKISIFSNTLKQTKENIRVLSIKQECIELSLNGNSKKVRPSKSKMGEKKSEKDEIGNKDDRCLNFLKEYEERNAMNKKANIQGFEDS